MYEASYKGKIKKYLKITCSITEKPSASFKADENSSSLRIFPDKDKQIYIAEDDEVRIEGTAKKLINVLFTEDRLSATEYLPVDTRFIDRLGNSNPSSNITVAPQPNSRENHRQEGRSIETKLSLETMVVIPKAERSQLKKNSNNIDRYSKSLTNTIKQLTAFILLVGFGMYSLKTVLQGNSLEAKNQTISVQALSTPTPDPIVKVKPAPIPQSKRELNYLKNDAISYLLSQNKSIAALVVRGDKVAIAANDRLLITNTNSYSQQKNFNLKGIAPSSVAIAKDGKIAIGTKSGEIKILDSNGKVTHEFKQNYEILSLGFSADSKNIVIANSAGKLAIFSLFSNEKILSLFGHSGAINQVLVTKDKIFTAGSDNTVRVWDFSGKQLKLFQDNNEVFSLAVSEDGNYIYSGNSRGIIRKWDYQTETESDSYSWQNQKISTLAIANNKLISGSNDRSVLVLDLDDRNNRKIFLNQGNYINSVAISSDGKSIFVANNERVNVWQQDP